MLLCCHPQHGVYHAVACFASTRLCACARGVKKHGGEVKLNAHVEQVLMEKGRAVGVRLKSGQVIKTRKVALPPLACQHLLIFGILCACSAAPHQNSTCLFGQEHMHNDLSYLASKKSLVPVLSLLGLSKTGPRHRLVCLSHTTAYLLF